MLKKILPLRSRGILVRLTKLKNIVFVIAMLNNNRIAVVEKHKAKLSCQQRRRHLHT